jgi:hypothetical protein
LSLHIRQFLRREDATATMEFVITFPIIMILFIAVFETSMIMTRQVMMERTLDQAVRILRLANGLTVTPGRHPHGDLRQHLTAARLRHASDDRPARDRPRDLRRAGQPGDVHRARGRRSRSTPRSTRVDNQLMMVRACMIIDRMLPFSGFGLNLTRDDSGGLHMMAASVFVNEPD